MPSQSPDLERDVIVQHSPGGPGREEQWAVYVGGNKRTELSSAQQALVFARLLADLQQRPIWMRHGSDGELAVCDTSQVRGCSCC